MASIPLPALGVRVEQPEGPLEQYSKIASLKAMMGQQQIQQQAIKAGSQENQIRQQQLDDQKTVMSTLTAHNGSLESALPELSGKVSPKTFLELQKGNLETREKLAKIHVDELAIQKDKNDRLSSLAQQAIALPDDQYAAAWPQIVANAKAIKPDLQLDPNQPLPKAQIQQLQLGLMTSEQYLKQEQERRAAKKADAELPGIVADSAKSVKVNAGTSPNGITAEQQAKLKGEAQARFEAARHNKAQENPFGQLPTGAGNAQGAQILSQMQPAQQAFMKSLLEYRIDPKMIPARGAARLQILGLASQIDPTFNEQNYAARNKMMQSFTSGPESKSINSINTAIGHVGVLGDAIGALDNGNIQLLNKIANGFGVAVGKDQTTTFNAIVHKVGPELVAAYTQGGGGQAEREIAEKDFDPQMGTKQLKSNVAITAKLLRSKISSNENQWKQTMGRDDFEQRFIMPEAQQTLDKYSPKQAQSGGSAFSVTDPNGGVHNFKTQAEADGFKKAIGGK